VSPPASLDVRALRLARSRGHGRRAERVIARFSALGEHAAIWLALGGAGMALDRDRRPQWARATRSVASAYLANQVLKFVVRRPRPQLRDLPPLISTPTELSFPSAHATSSFAGALAFTRMGLPAGPLYLLAGALAVSRLYLGVHYPSDVIAGAALGTAIAAVAADRGP
jgi:membrane-associated phospholipid phosphatase